jgi:hypothetical protein
VLHYFRKDEQVAFKKITNPDEWVNKFNLDVAHLIHQPYREIMLGAFSDWRISYGTSNQEGNVYFVSFYPAFCTKPKLTYHYTNVSELAMDMLAISGLIAVGFSQSDAVAISFSLLRDKESIELFKEQKDLMVLGLKHYHLDNFYQDTIKLACREYFKAKTIRGKSFSLTLFSRAK